MCKCGHTHRAPRTAFEYCRNHSSAVYFHATLRCRTIILLSSAPWQSTCKRFYPLLVPARSREWLLWPGQAEPPLATSPTCPRFTAVEKALGWACWGVVVVDGGCKATEQEKPSQLIDQRNERHSPLMKAHARPRPRAIIMSRQVGRGSIPQP